MFDKIQFCLTFKDRKKEDRYIVIEFILSKRFDKINSLIDTFLNSLSHSPIFLDKTQFCLTKLKRWFYVTS